MIHVYGPEHVELWCVLEEAGATLDLTVCDAAALGEPREWYTYERDENGHDEWFNRGSEGWTRWAIDNGIAPGQPFRVRLGQPSYSTSYDGEVDADIPEAEVLEIERFTPREVHLAWEHFFMERWRELDERQRQAAVVHERQRTDFDALFLAWDSYFVGNEYFDEMSAPTGALARLCSHHASYYIGNHGTGTAWLWLAEGRDDDGNRDRAFMDLLRNAEKLLPEIPRIEIETLRHACGFGCGRTRSSEGPTCGECRPSYRRLMGITATNGGTLDDTLAQVGEYPERQRRIRQLCRRVRLHHTEFDAAIRLGADDRTIRGVLGLPEPEAAA